MGKSREGSTVAVVTGASRGLGRVCAQRLASEGLRVVLVARSVGGLRETERLITETGGQAESVECDVSAWKSVSETLKPIVGDRFGVPQVLINAAGVFGQLAMVQDSDPDQWSQTIDINLKGTFHTCRAFLAEMVGTGWGRIINVTSSSSVVAPMPMQSAYAASKGGVNLLTRALAREIEGTGITANVVHPGDVKTGMSDHIAGQAERSGQPGDKFREWAHWLEETGGDSPQKFADVVMSLVDDSGETNGEFLWIDEPAWGRVPTW